MRLLWGKARHGTGRHQVAALHIRKVEPSMHCTRMQVTRLGDPGAHAVPLERRRRCARYLVGTTILFVVIVALIFSLQLHALFGFGKTSHCPYDLRLKKGANVRLSVRHHLGDTLVVRHSCNGRRIDSVVQRKRDCCVAPRVTSDMNSPIGFRQSGVLPLASGNLASGNYEGRMSV